MCTANCPTKRSLLLLSFIGCLLLWPSYPCQAVGFDLKPEVESFNLSFDHAQNDLREAIAALPSEFPHGNPPKLVTAPFAEKLADVSRSLAETEKATRAIIEKGESIARERDQITTAKNQLEKQTQQISAENQNLESWKSTLTLTLGGSLGGNCLAMLGLLIRGPARKLDCRLKKLEIVAKEAELEKNDIPLPD